MLNEGVQMVNDLYDNIKENNLLYIGLFVVILLCILTIYFLYTMIGEYLFLKVNVTVSETTVPVLCNKFSSFDAKFPDIGNGRRKSFSFWIYISDISKNYSYYKTVAAVSDNNKKDESIYRTASPHIFLDKNNNSMYCHFYDKSFNTEILNFGDINESKIDDYMRTGIKIKYVPLQRWVHIAFVVNSDSFTTSIYAYVDGDLVNIEKHGNFDSEKIKKDFNTIDLTQTKYLLVGGDSTNIKNSPGFSGLISNFSCYNYELNQNDINNIYNKGPVNGLLAYLGLGMYGVRYPIYKL